MTTSLDHRETPLDNLLSALTDAIVADRADLDAITRQYAVPQHEFAALVTLIQRLHVTLVGVQPSRRFVTRLKHDLIGEPQTNNVLGRFRHLPPRVQIAAMIVVMAGFMLLSRRRLLIDARKPAALSESLPN